MDLAVSRQLLMPACGQILVTVNKGRRSRGACSRLFQPSGSIPDCCRAERWSPRARASWCRSRVFFWGRCPACQKTWQLSPGPCQQCIPGQKIRGLPGDQAGVVRGDLAPLHQALSAAGRPGTALARMSRPKARGLLTGPGSEDRRLTREIPGELPAGRRR